MPISRNIFPALFQAPPDALNEIAAEDRVLAITQGVAATAAAAEGTDVALDDDPNAEPGASSGGHLRRKARQWLGKFGKKSPASNAKGFRVPPMAPNKKKSVQSVTFALPEPSGPTLLTQASASALACAARIEAGRCLDGPSRYFDAHLIKQLLRRDTPKTETFEQLSAAPVERALESILADEAIGRVPAHLFTPLAEVGRASAEVFEAAQENRRLVWTRALCDLLRREYPLPWVVKTPIITLLCVGEDSDQTKAEAMVKFLRERPVVGFGALATVAILRAMYLAADREGFASQTVPFISQANNHYINHMIGLTGRIYVDWGAEKPKRQGVGLTDFHAPSPIDASWMQPSTITCHLYRPSPDCSRVVKDLAYGNPYGCGISGSTNIFLFAAAHFNALGATRVDLMAITSAMGAVLAYNGGHSFNEVYAAAQMYPDAGSTSLAALSDYHPGHARGLFIDQVDPHGDWLEEASFRRLAAFLIDQEKPV